MRTRLPALLLAGSLACSNGPASPSAEVTLVNLTGVSITWVAVIDGSLVDPVPTLSRDYFADRIVVPRGTRVVDDIDGWSPGNGATFYLYRISDDGLTATLAAWQTVSATELAATRRVVVNRLN